MIKNTNWRFIFLSIISGALLAFAFAPIKAFFLAFLCPAVLLYVLINNQQRAAFWYGLLFGLAFFGLGCSWVFISIHDFGGAGLILSAIITFLFILLMSCYPALMSYVFCRFFKNASVFSQCVLVFPALWVVFEWLRAWVFSGFPWVFLGYSQSFFPLKYLAPILSVYGVSLFVALISGLLVWFFLQKNPREKVTPLIAIAIVCFGSWGLSFINWTQPKGKPIQVSLVQGNIPLQFKWNNEYLHKIVKTYEQETQKHWKSDIILWPEAAIPISSREIPGFIKYMNQTAKAKKTALIFGIPSFNPKSKAYYNSIKVLGDGSGHYNKRHLVPFGEYTPIGSIFTPLMERLNIPMSGFDKGAYDQKLLIAKGLKVAPFICYEIAFPHEVLRFSKGSNLLVTISDDAWFGKSFASAQQLQMAQMRAIETERPILYGTNNGITAVIDSNGSIKKRLPKDTLDTLTTSVQPTEGETWVMQSHNLIVAAIIIFMLLLGFFLKKGG